MSFSDREPRRLDSESESLRLPRACTATPGKVTPSGPTYGSHARRGAGKGLRVGVPVVVTVTRSKCPRLRPRVTRCTGAFTWSASSRCHRTSYLLGRSGRAPSPLYRFAVLARQMLVFSAAPAVSAGARPVAPPHPPYCVTTLIARASKRGVGCYAHWVSSTVATGTPNSSLRASLRVR